MSTTDDVSHIIHAAEKLKIDDMADSQIDMTKGSPRLLEYSAEIRNIIYAYAVPLKGKIAVRSRACRTPPLAQVSKQLREEVTPIFFEHNTFHFANIRGIDKWLPFSSPTTTLNWLALDLQTSIMFFHTITQYLLQPTKVLHEDEFLTNGERNGAGVKPARTGATVIWGTREKIIESLAENPRPYPFLRLDHLEAVVREREAKEKEKAEAAWKKEMFEAGIASTEGGG